MNTLKKLTLAALILGTGSQTINAYPWSPKAIAAVTLAGLGYGAVKYYGFNTVTNAVLERCANAKNWMFGKISNKLSDAVYGSYKKQIQQLRDQRTKFLEEKIEEEAILKEAINEVQADRKDAHERAINLTKQIMEQNKTLKTLKAEKDRIEEMMRKQVDGLHTRSVHNESDKKAALTEVERLQAIVAEQVKTIAQHEAMLTQMQAKLAGVAVAPSDEGTSESDSAQQDNIE